MEEKNTSSAASIAASIAASSKEFETDTVIGFITRKTVKGGAPVVGAAITYICSLDGVPPAPFAPIAREFLQQRLPALKLDESVKELDAQLTAAKGHMTISCDKQDQIVTSWVRRKRLQLGLDEKIAVPQITRADTVFFNRIEVLKRQIAAAAKHEN